MDSPAQSHELEILVRKHEQTLYGENGDNGLRGTVKEHTAQLSTMEKRIYLLCAVFAAAGGSAPELLKSFLS